MSENRLTSLAGVWTATISHHSPYDMRIPGTLDENNIGAPDRSDRQQKKKTENTGVLNSPDLLPSELAEQFLTEREDEKKSERILSRYTRNHAHDGVVRISRNITYKEHPGKRLFLEVERARVLRLFIDDEEVGHYTQQTLVTPHVFEVTGLLDGTHTVLLTSNNTYPALPEETILASAMAADDGQTNWNGLLGYVRLREEEVTFLNRAVFKKEGDSLTAYLDIASSENRDVRLAFSSELFDKEYDMIASIPAPYARLRIPGLRLNKEIKNWDEGEDSRYEIAVSINGTVKTIQWAYREFSQDEAGRLTLNKRRIFLRGAECAGVFPELGHMPMDKAAWQKFFTAYRNYGVNFIRFRSCCPPEEAFQAADEMGLLLMAELSMKSDLAFETETEQNYYKAELVQILRCYGHHPSFVMMAMGCDSLVTEKGQAFLETLLQLAKKLDPDRFYTTIADSPLSLNDNGNFCMLDSYEGEPLHGVTFGTEEELDGHINSIYPTQQFSYHETMEKIREKYTKPVVSCGAGQYAIYPDFREIDLFSGIFSADNLSYLRELSEEKGLLGSTARFIEASGRNAVICMKEEIESALRTEGLSGMVFRSLSDYPGEGSLFYGLMNAFCIPKPYPFADSKKFRSYFGEMLPMAELERFTYEYDDTLIFNVLFSNYSKETVTAPLKYRLKGDGIDVRGEFFEQSFSSGEVSSLGKVRIRLSEENGFERRKAVRCTLTISVGKAENEYPIFVYPQLIPICPESVHETPVLDKRTIKVLEEGGTVFLTPPATEEGMPGSVKCHFSTAFRGGLYKGGTKEAPGKQSAVMGQMINTEHPLLRGLPTEFFTDLQWWTEASGRAIELPDKIRPIISEIDSPYTLRNLGQLFEFRMLNGNVLFSTMGIKENMQHPEVRALLNNIYDYLDSYEFSPSEELRPEELRPMIHSILEV